MSTFSLNFLEQCIRLQSPESFTMASIVGMFLYGLCRLHGWFLNQFNCWWQNCNLIEISRGLYLWIILNLSSWRGAHTWRKCTLHLQTFEDLRNLFPQLYKRTPLLAFTDKRRLSDIFVARVHKRMFDLRNRMKGEVDGQYICICEKFSDSWSYFFISFCFSVVFFFRYNLLVNIPAPAIKMQDRWME